MQYSKWPEVAIKASFYSTPPPQPKCHWYCFDPGDIQRRSNKWQWIQIEIVTWFSYYIPWRATVTHTFPSIKKQPVDAGKVKRTMYPFQGLQNHHPWPGSPESLLALVLLKTHFKSCSLGWIHISDFVDRLLTVMEATHRGEPWHSGRDSVITSMWFLSVQEIW